jgi:hypothetical protein
LGGGLSRKYSSNIDSDIEADIEAEEKWFSGWRLNFCTCKYKQVEGEGKKGRKSI